ncbi:hypothetical protein CPB83DRAFT_864520 [Crepidotus variabilis]|uniref:Uncharacterized protein n=1 Tax=Crepidotus variabilis TaxID=179855 RepID=A0A9P6JIV2_9AGAR|nr:hypothetical protein CPB83DRAFT_864520 [Crepidotus variabilis]
MQSKLFITVIIASVAAIVLGTPVPAPVPVEESTDVDAAFPSKILWGERRDV